jgi:phosphatidylserine/phosphatidylglycerophosphate/cardiolipin synthase-like enzyme
MQTRPEGSLATAGASAATLRRIAAALRSGRLAVPVTSFGLASVAECPPALAGDLRRLSVEGLSAPHLALVLDLAAEAIDARMQGEAASELVWSGPETAHARSRDTFVVLEEMFSSAERTVYVSTYAIRQPDRVFATLGARLDAVPTLQARLFVHIDRVPGDTRTDAALVRDYSERLGNSWPGHRRPEVYYDPRGLSTDPQTRASWHAKCVLVDDEAAFVTSANFTEWAQHRNVEAGVLIRSRHFTTQLRAQFDALVTSKQVTRFPGL